jgi:hypothetical protein
MALRLEGCLPEAAAFGAIATAQFMLVIAD